MVNAVCLVVVVFTGVVSLTKEKYKTLPLNEQTKSILEKVQYDNAVSALLGAVATKIGAKLGDDQERKSRLCACVHQAQDVHQYAECLVPFVEKKRIRSKRGTSVVESTFNWLAWLAEKVNSVLFSKFASSATSRNDQSMGIGKSSRREQSTRWSEWYWSNFWYKITTTTTTSDDDWLPEWPIPDWLREMTKDVHQLIKEMKQQQQEAWPEYRILSPRLFPWEERSSKSVNLLSPDVFSLSDNYDNDTDQSVSVGKLIDRLNLKERLALLGLVEQVDRLVDQYHQRQQQWRDLKSSQEKTVTKLIDTFTRLEQSYTEEQTRSIQTRGYAFLSEHQLRIIYDDGKLPVDIDTYRTMTVDEKNEALEYQLLQLSKSTRKKRRRRCKRSEITVGETIVLWPFIGSPTVGNVIFCKTDFLKIPVNEDGKTLTDGIMYQRTVNLLMSTLVTNELRHHDKTETERLINCTSKAENIADHANCHVPYLQMSIDRIDKQIVPPRVKRSTTTTKESSTLERLFNWLRKLFREMRKYSSSTSSWKGSAGDEDDLEDEPTKYDVDFDIHLGTNELLANVEKAIAENNFESLLPDMPLPGWFRELAYDVFELIKDMKVIEDIPPLRVLSPRILALTPDANRTIDLLSPDLLSLYEDGSKNVFPTKQSKQMLSRRERDALLNLILELGNVPKLVRDIKRLTMSQRKAKRAQSSRMVKLEKEEALVELGEKFKLLDASLTRQQRQSINSTGYAFLNSDQMRLVHNGSLSEEKLFEYVQMTEMDKERWLREELRKIAEEKQLHRRRQRSANKTEEVDVLHPMVQGPRGDEPLVAGHVILNPKIFSPVVLSPNMVSSSILSPLVLSPIILSPMAVNPIVLSPGMLNPLILSPAVLSPLILSPVLLIPSILSPGAFNPSILSPTLLTAAVLSPSALSPVIRSPHRLFAAVLSPSYMSPSINSTCSACAIVASPCFLC
ncbi:hypothetical protein Tsp_04191 [Trichinella spiralis]|uniref:hypothetical protein n=1 Tax=Trichinella spiralis TaxID=6334 RepID=UPI0001EFBB27|nr:hypothetical protein Tsp_04191 [Trichinella spiralis]